MKPIRAFSKFLYYYLQIDIIRRVISFDIQSSKFFVNKKSVTKNNLFTIGNLPTLNKDFCLLFAATPDYIYTFLPRLIEQLKVSNSFGNTDLIVGVITNSKHEREELENVFLDVKFVGIFPHFNNNKSSKNCARFLLVQKLIQTGITAPILVADIDIFINSNLNEFIQNYNNINGLKLRRGWDVRFYCFAGCLFLNSENRQLIIDDLCERIRKRFHTKNWYTDQISLWFTYKKFSKSFSVLTETEFSIKTKTAIIYAYKGKNKPKLIKDGI